MKDYTLYQVYKLCSIVEDAIAFSTPLESSTIKLRQQKAITFNKETLLHLFIKEAFINHYDHFFCEMTESINDEVLELLLLNDQFANYDVDIDFLEIKYDENDFPVTTQNQIINWYKRNRKKFTMLSEKLCNEIFHILFANKSLLHKFNESLVMHFDMFEFVPNQLTRKGTLKRKKIPKWVQNAVFHRDKGRCSICSTDLTKVINLESVSNFDHIIPLDMFGVNDPTNIQLLCKKCNSDKLNRSTEFGTKYEEWFI